MAMAMHVYIYMHACMCISACMGKHKQQQQQDMEKIINEKVIGMVGGSTNQIYGPLDLKIRMYIYELLF